MANYQHTNCQRGSPLPQGRTKVGRAGAVLPCAVAPGYSMIGASMTAVAPGSQGSRMRVWQTAFESRFCLTAACIGSTLFLGSCATSTDLILPDGSKGYSLNCGGAANTWGTCLKKAGELCKERGYEILARDQNTGQFTALSADQYSAFGSSSAIIYREMIVKCR